MSNLNEPYTINSPESDDENNSHSGSPALQEPSEPSANPSPRPSHNIFSTITNILEDETRRTVSHLSAGLKEVRKTRKAREADFKAMEQEVSKLRVEAARKMGKREEEESIEQEIRGIEESTEAKRRMIQELESQLLECQREDMNLWAWKRRLATIAMQQQAAIDKAAPRIAEAENQQVDLFRKAKELEEEQRGYYDGLNTSIEQIMELHTQMMALATDVNSVDVEKGVTVEQLEEATRMVVRAGTERLKRWAHRQNIRATVETTKEVFQTLEEDAKLAILNFEALIEKEEDSYLDHRKDFADEQTRRYNGLVRFSTEKWETFDWSRCYEQEYEILEVTLAKPYAEVDLGTFFIDDIVTMSKSTRPYRIDMGLPIEAGDFRQVHRVKDCKTNTICMGKVFHTIRGLETDRKCAINMAKISVICDVVAKKFCEVLKRAKFGTWTIDCIPVRLVSLLYAPAASETNLTRDPTCMMIEEFLPGQFMKFVDNFGEFSKDYENQEVMGIFSAMAHWSFAASRGRFLVADLQGSADPANRRVILTDPGVHTVDRTFAKQLDNDMDANYRIVGVATFFEKHICNGICKHLGLEAFTPRTGVR